MVLMSLASSTSAFPLTRPVPNVVEETPPVTLKTASAVEPLEALP